MAVVVLFFACAIPVCWLYGRLTLRACALLPSVREIWEPSFALTALIGLASLTVLANIASLLGSVGLEDRLLFSAAAIAYGVADRASLWAALRRHGKQARDSGWAVAILVIVAALICVTAAVRPAAHYDTGLYYAQAIRWIEECGVVPGLGNLHDRFVANAMWFAAEALFGLPAPRRHILNSVLYLLFLLSFIAALADWQRGHRGSSVVIRIALIPISLHLFTGWMSSPTPDIPAAILTWTAWVLFFDEAENRSLDQAGARQAAIVLFSAVAVGVKLAVLPLVILPAYLVGHHVVRRNTRAAALLIGILAFVAIPLVARTVIASGYLVYPFSALDVLNVDWKMSADRVDNVTRWVTSWARIPMRQPDEVLALPINAWVPIWYGRLPLLAKTFLLASGILTIAHLGISLTRRSARTRVRSRSGTLVAVLTAYAGVAYWLATAPEPRFGWAFLSLLPLLLAAELLRALLDRVPVGVWTLLLAALIVHFVGSSYRSDLEARHHLMRPPPYPVPEVKNVRFGNFSCAVPVHGDQCWYEPFPCTAPSLGHTVIKDPTELLMRGNTWGQGFRWKVR